MDSSPKNKDSPNLTKIDPQFSSPIQFVQVSTRKRNSGSSHEEEILGKYSHSFKNIIERQHEDSSSDYDQDSFEINNQTDRVDIMGNLLPICQFDTRSDQEQYEQKVEIIEDKENEIPALKCLYTPLKNKEGSLGLRSPLRDITPSLTKKKKQNVMSTISDKNSKLTPKTLTESRISNSGLRRLL